MTNLFRVLLAASPSFNDGQLFNDKVTYLLQHKPEYEMHCLTQKVFTKMCTDFAKCVVHKRDFFMEGPQTTVIIYNKIIQFVDAVIIFWDGETTNEQRLIHNCQHNNVKHVVVRYKSFKQELQEAKEALKLEPKRKKITTPLSKDAIARYQKAHEKWFIRMYPSAYKDGHYATPKILPINSGGRMDSFIVNFLVWEGWSATKVNIMGRKVAGKWIASTTKPGTFDLSATIKGRSVKIETKHSADRPSEDQLKMQLRERNAGAIAEFVYSIDEFFVLYDKILNLP